MVVRIIVGVGIVIGLLALNVYLLRTNKKTPVPPGCENLKPDCKGCGIGDCPVRQEPMMKKESENNNGDR